MTTYCVWWNRVQTALFLCIWLLATTFLFPLDTYFLFDDIFRDLVIKNMRHYSYSD